MLHHINRQDKIKFIRMLNLRKVLNCKGTPRESDRMEELVTIAHLFFLQIDAINGSKRKLFCEEIRILSESAARIVDRTWFSSAAKLAPELQSRVMEVCIEHTQAMDRLAQRLSGNLVLALPDSPQSFRPFSASEPRAPGKPRPFEELSELSAMAQSIARRIHHFIYPRDFTVSLSDLKKPGLLEALKGLRAKAMIFLQHMVRNGKS